MDQKPMFQEPALSISSGPVWSSGGVIQCLSTCLEVTSFALS